VIETERLSLRLPRLEDASGLGESVASIQRWLDEWCANDIGYFTVVRNGSLVGRVGFHVFDARTWTLSSFAVAGRHARAELGWTLVPQHRSHGYATEAARAVRSWANRAGVISLIEPSNEPSARVARRLDATPTATAIVTSVPCVVWEHPR